MKASFKVDAFVLLSGLAAIDGVDDVRPGLNAQTLGAVPGGAGIRATPWEASNQPIGIKPIVPDPVACG